MNILESSLRTALQKNSNRYSDPDLQAMAERDAALALPFHAVLNSYRMIPLLQRARSVTVIGPLFDTSVIAVFENIDAPQ